MSGRTLLVTGGAQRLGRMITLACAETGWTPVIHYNRSSAEAEALAKELGGYAIGGDLSASGMPEDLMAKAVEAAGPISGLVNSASIFEHDAAQDATEDSLLKNFRVNAIAPILLAKAFAAQAPEGSAIVNMLDQKLFNLNADHFSYTVSKQALHGATMTMARAFAPKVRVIGVAPGYNLPSPGQDEATFERLAPTVNVMKKRLQPEHVAETVRFALENPAITGQVLLADNGEHLQSAERDVIFKS